MWPLHSRDDLAKCLVIAFDQPFTTLLVTRSRSGAKLLILSRRMEVASHSLSGTWANV